MKTPAWVAENQILLLFIGLVLLAWFLTYLARKYATPSATRVIDDIPVYDTTVINPVVPVFNPIARPTFGVRTSTQSSGASMAGAGARVGGGGKSGI